jgi:hypothetical protein
MQSPFKKFDFYNHRLSKTRDYKQHDNDSDNGSDQHYEHPPSERPLARCVGGYDLRTRLGMVVRRWLDVIQFDGVNAVRLDEGFHDGSPFLQ